MTVKTVEEGDSKSRIQQVIEFTKCSEYNAEEALSQCGDDVCQAVEMIFDKGLNVDDWQVKEKTKVKKTLASNPTSAKTDKTQNKNKRDNQKQKQLPKQKKAENKPKKQDSDQQANHILSKKNEPEALNTTSSPVQEKNWDVDSEYDEWNGEAIEILNSNSQIALETCDEPKVDENNDSKLSEKVEKSFSQKVEELFSTKPTTKPPPRAVRFPLVKPIIFSPDLLAQYQNKCIDVTFGDVLGRKNRETKPASIPKPNLMDSYKKNDQRMNMQNDNSQNMPRNSLDVNQMKQQPTLSSNMINHDPVRNNFQQFRGYNHANLVEPVSNQIDLDKMANLNMVDNGMVILPTVSSSCSPGNMNHMIPSNQNTMRRSNPPQTNNGPSQQHMYNNNKQQSNQFNKINSFQVNSGVALPPGINQSSQSVNNMIGSSNEPHGITGQIQLNSQQVIHQFSNNRPNPVTVINNEQIFQSNPKGSGSIHSNQQASNIYLYDQNMPQNQSNSRNTSNNGNYEMSDLKIPASAKTDNNSQMVTMVHSGGHQSSGAQSHHNIQGHMVETSPGYYPLSGMMFMSPVTNNPIYPHGPPHHSNSSANAGNGNPNNQANDINFHQSNFNSHKPSSANPQSMFNQNSQYHPHHHIQQPANHHHHQSHQQLVAAHAIQLHDIQKNFSTGTINNGPNDQYKNNSYDKQQNQTQMAYMQGGAQSQNYLILSGHKHVQNKSHR